MGRERTDLDIPAGTVWPESEQPGDTSEEPIELGPGEQPPVSLDPERNAAERNAASGGWDGANEQIENDFEVEQLRRDQESPSDEDVPLT